MKTGILNTAQFFIISIALAASITGCSPKSLLPATSAAVPLTPTVVETRMPTKTPEHTAIPTETPEPTPTPEIYTGNPNDIDSWPEKFKNYYVNNPEDQSMDQEFQKFMDKIRLDYLKEKGVEGLEKMDKDEIFFNYLKHTAIDKQKCILTITEIMNIIGDPDIGSLEFRNIHVKGEMYGIWYNSSPATSQILKEKTHTTSVYGRDLLVHRGMLLDMTTGDLVGVVDLPGTKENYALLVRIRDLNNRNHYVIRRIVGEKMENLEDFTMEVTTIGEKNKWYELSGDMNRLMRERIVWPPIYVNIREANELATKEAENTIEELYFFDESGIEAAGELFIPTVKENPKSGEY